MEATYELVGRGSDLAIQVRGPGPEACLVAAIEGFGASLADVEAGTDRRRRPVEVDGATPAHLLLALMDEAILRLDSDGELAVALEDTRIDGDTLAGTLEVVWLDEVQVHGVSPKAATWHDLRLEETADGWEGHVMLDL